jgi:hypothetical membrane protein
MRISLGFALFLVLSGFALFGIGLARADTYYIASGVPIFFLGTIIAGIVLGKCREKSNQEGNTVGEGITAIVMSTNPAMKKNKSDTDLKLMGHMDDEMSA